jgi:hypothetical protein
MLAQQTSPAWQVVGPEHSNCSELAHAPLAVQAPTPFDTQQVSPGWHPGAPKGWHGLAASP